MILKIRDDVNLKRLEKFGFKYKDYDGGYYEYDIGDNRSYFVVDVKTREIGLPTSLYGDVPALYIDGFGVLYELTIANMVEKVNR